MQVPPKCYHFKWNDILSRGLWWLGMSIFCDACTISYWTSNATMSYKAYLLSLTLALEWSEWWGMFHFLLWIIYNCSCIWIHWTMYIYCAACPLPVSTGTSFWTTLWGENRYFGHHHLGTTKGAQWRSYCSLLCGTWAVPEWVHYKCENRCQTTNACCYRSFG